MPVIPSTEELRNVTLQKIGRNVVNFQKMPMGRLVEEAADGLYSLANMPPEPSVTEVTVSMSFELEGGNDEPECGEPQ